MTDAEKQIFDKLVSACEKDYMSKSTESDEPGPRCDDEESVSSGGSGDSAITFGMIREARRALRRRGILSVAAILESRAAVPSGTGSASFLSADGKPKAHDGE